MKPGLTGLWQVSARSDPNFESRVHFDLHYVNNWSLLLDAKILAKTIPVVVLGEGGKINRPVRVGPRNRLEHAPRQHRGGVVGARLELGGYRRSLAQPRVELGHASRDARSHGRRFYTERPLVANCRS